MQPQTSSIPKAASRPVETHRCPFCGSPVMYNGNGRPRDYCDKPCQRTLAALSHLEAWIEQVKWQTGTPQARRAADALKSRLFSLANRIGSRGGGPL